MLPLETKQSGGKLLPHSDLRGGNVSRGSMTQAYFVYYTLENGYNVSGENIPTFHLLVFISSFFRKNAP